MPRIIKDVSVRSYKRRKPNGKYRVVRIQTSRKKKMLRKLKCSLGLHRYSIVGMPLDKCMYCLNQKRIR